VVTLAEKLCELSGLPSGTATVEEHLCAITAGAGAGTGASDLVVGFIVDVADITGIIETEDEVLAAYSSGDEVFGVSYDGDSVVGSYSGDDEVSGIVVCDDDILP